MFFIKVKNFQNLVLFRKKVQVEKENNIPFEHVVRLIGVNRKSLKKVENHFRILDLKNEVVDHFDVFVLSCGFDLFLVIY